MSPNESEAPAATRLTPVADDLLRQLRRNYEVWNPGGPEAMRRQVWHPEIAWHDPPDFPDASVVRGAAAVEAHLRARIDTLGHSPVEVQQATFAQDEDHLLVELGLRSGGRVSGVQLETRLYHVIRLRDGRPTEVREFLNDRERAVAALREG